MYVMLHELAHVACPDSGHGITCVKIFEFLTQIAVSRDIYNYENY